MVASLVATTRRAEPKSSNVDGVELAPDLFADDGAAGQHRDVAEHLLAAVAEARRLDGEDLDGALELVDDQRGQGLAVDVLADDQRGLALLDGLLERREHVLDAGDLLVRDQDERVVEDRFHAIRVGDEVRREVAAVELHALGVFLLEAQALALFDGDDAVLADLVHHLGDDLADFRVGGADGRDSGDLGAVVDRAGLLGDLGHDGRDGGFDAVLDDHRVRPGGHDAQALGDHRLAEHDRGGGAVAGDVVGLGGDFLEQLGAHVLERVVELDVASDRDAVVGDGRSAELLVEDDVAALGADRDLDRVGEAIDAALQRATSGLVEDELLSQSSVPPGTCGSEARRRRGRQPSTIARMSFWLDDEEVLVIELEFGPGVLGVEDLVALLDVHRLALAVFEQAARAGRHDGAFLGLLLDGVREDDAALGHLLARGGLDDHTIAQRAKLGRRRSGFGQRAFLLWRPGPAVGRGSCDAGPAAWGRRTIVQVTR